MSSHCNNLIIPDAVKGEVRWKDTKQRRIVEGYKGKKKCKRRTKKKNLSVYIFTKPAVVCFFITTKNKSSLLQEHNLFWLTVKDFSGNCTTGASKKLLNKHKIKDQSLLIILYNLVEFKITGLPNSLLFSCSLSLPVGNRIFLEEKSLGELRSTDATSTISPAGSFPWSFRVSRCQGPVKLASDTVTLAAGSAELCFLPPGSP